MEAASTFIEGKDLDGNDVSIGQKAAIVFFAVWKPGKWLKKAWKKGKKIFKFGKKFTSEGTKIADRIRKRLNGANPDSADLQSVPYRVSNTENKATAIKVVVFFVHKPKAFLYMETKR